MSLSRTVYDECVYEQNLKQSTTPLSFILDPIQYQNNNQCRMELGIVGGNAVSHVQGNLVDTESDLRGQTRPSAQCPQSRYFPAKDKAMVHLPPCQMIDYGSVASTPAMKPSACGSRR